MTNTNLAHCRRVHIVCIVLMAFSLIGMKMADAYSPDPSEICPTDSDVVSSQRLLAHVLDEFGITDWTLDTQGKPISQEMKELAITSESFCEDSKTNICAKKAQAILVKAQSGFRRFLVGASKELDDNYVLTQISPPPVSTDIAKSYLVFHQYVLKCKRLKKNAEDTGNAATANAPPPNSNIEFAIRGGIDDLLVDKGGEKATFKGLSGATFGFVHDSAKQSRSYTANAVYGIRFPAMRGTGFVESMRFVPFVSQNRSDTASTTPPEAPNQNTYGLGVLAGLQLNAGFTHELSLAPKMIKNFRDDSRITSVFVNYRPEPGIRFIDFPIQIGNQLAIGLKPSAFYSRSHVNAIGSNVTLPGQSEFSMYGPSAELNIYGFSGGFFSNFSASHTYRKFHVSKGIVSSFEVNQSSISYSPNPSGSLEHISITLKYVSGRDPDTFAVVRALTLGLGVKY